MTRTWRILSKGSVTGDGCGCNRPVLICPLSPPLRAVILASKREELARPTKLVEVALARALISYVATQILSISGSEVARRFNADRSAISRASQRISRDPELPAATKTIQRELELETNQH